MRRVYVSWFLLHFCFIGAISCRDIVWLIAHKPSSTPQHQSKFAEGSDPISATAVGQTAGVSNWLRRGLIAYLHLSGIDRGYSYFAPNIPGAGKLVLELHYRDGRVQYELPKLNGKAADLHLATLLDEIARTESIRFREYLIRRVALSVWREHADAISIRAIFGISILPTAAEFEKGARESYKFVDAYDFNLPNDSDRSQKR